MPEVIMPRLSDTMAEGELSRWLKKVGDESHKGGVLAEIETDKATIGLEAFDVGILEQLLVEAGTLVPIGAPVAVIGDDSETAAVDAPAAPAEDAGDKAPNAGAAKTEPDKSAEAEPTQPEADAEKSGTPVPKNTELRTSPLARKIAREHDIDLATVAGTGPQGRIARADVEAAIAAGAASVKGEPAEEASTTSRSTAAPADASAATETIPVSKIRKVTARRLTESQTVAHFFLTSVVDVERLVAFRAEVNASLAALGTKVSLNDLFVRACAIVLRQHPGVNSSWGGDAVLRHKRINVGIAVATDDGLLVPVVADTDTKSLGAIAVETVELAGKARTGQLGLNEMSGGTFTISNLGMFDIDQFTAVINPPEAAILAVGSATDVPVVRDGQLLAVPKAKITLTVDHRVLDGATAAAFLRDLKKLLEEPLRIVV